MSSIGLNYELLKFIYLFKERDILVYKELILGIHIVK